VRPSGIFRAYTCLVAPAAEEYSQVEVDDDRFIVRQGGRKVAVAWSVRQNAHTAEVAVETHISYRRRGYARQVTAAWAAAQLRRGLVPLYSHKAENLASQALAHSLGLHHFADSRTWE
jgi:predicted GNAT family acetyltransferase